ncbi:endoplasmic reticulum resident protein 44 isoform X1 [Thamnophis elegans]|uniref:endoplasmic reticulum resident protein 44 isoform X1 n=1 Tax=Thamnophis elegans TaxID=35005 RepID=UPI0013778C39|nr:endoplasmic reticulum resident protein 44 isoform X1 [Thamnophis elegans]
MRLTAASLKLQKARAALAPPADANVSQRWQNAVAAQVQEPVGYPGAAFPSECACPEASQKQRWVGGLRETACSRHQHGTEGCPIAHPPPGQAQKWHIPWFQAGRGVQGRASGRCLQASQKPRADIAQRYRISKYPTLKLFRNGMMMKREYRGQRSVTAIADYIRQQKSNPIREVLSLEEINSLDRNKRNIIGYFEQKDSDNYRNFERVANVLHDDCVFLAAFGSVSKPERFSGDNIIYKPTGENAPDMVYLGSMTNFDLAYAWTQDKCVPLVREITFENGEELTEEGLPFLILFHMKDDTESLERFQQEVARQLISEKGTINFLHADCDKFRHPLLHIQKSPADCPVIAIDSFRHMYVFSDFSDLAVPGKLKQFVLDLHSGKLHREFHHGPDPTDVAPGQPLQDIVSSPPESSFQKLAPSGHRYTLLREKDEL